MKGLCLPNRQVQQVLRACARVSELSGQPGVQLLCAPCSACGIRRSVLGASRRGCDVCQQQPWQLNMVRRARRCGASGSGAAERDSGR